ILDTILAAEDDGVILQVQDGIVIIEAEPLEETERVEEEVAALVEPKADFEKDKLEWDKEKWRMEREIRKEELLANIKSKRLTTIAALVQQGITDKDFILSIMGKKE
ncbi:hypothetical protein BGZ96_005394, partial [Linnemannia gamsii]